MRRRRALFFALWLAGWCVLALLMLAPAPGVSQAVSDKFAHFAVYLVMSAFALTFSTGQRILALTALITLLFGSGLEYAQSFVPSRSFDLLDIAANTAGTLAGYVVAATVTMLAARTSADAST